MCFVAFSGHQNKQRCPFADASRDTNLTSNTNTKNFWGLRRRFTYLARGRSAGTLHHELVLCREAAKFVLLRRTVHGCCWIWYSSIWIVITIQNGFSSFEERKDTAATKRFVPLKTAKTRRSHHHANSHVAPRDSISNFLVMTTSTVRFHCPL